MQKQVTNSDQLSALPIIKAKSTHVLTLQPWIFYLISVCVQESCTLL